MRIMLPRKITLAKLFGPKVPYRHLMGFGVVLNQGRRGKTFAQELRREISTSGLQHAPARLQERVFPSPSPALTPAPGSQAVGHVAQGAAGGDRSILPPSLHGAELWFSPEAWAVRELVFCPGTERG